MTLSSPADKQERDNPVPHFETPHDLENHSTRFSFTFLLKGFSAIFLTLWFGSDIRREDKI